MPVWTINEVLDAVTTPLVHTGDDVIHYYCDTNVGDEE